MKKNGNTSPASLSKETSVVRHSNAAPVHPHSVMLHGVPQAQNAALSKTKKVLHFGADYAVLNVVKKKDMMSKSSGWLRCIFDLPHNTTNSNIQEDVAWADTNELVNIQYAMTTKGEAAEIYQDGVHLFKITKVTEDWASNIHYPYTYRIDFYSQFFTQARNHTIDPLVFCKIFLDDIELGILSSSLSRIDVCADLSGYTPKDIEKSCIGIDNIPVTRFNQKHGESETVYFGNKNQNNKGFVRAYDKKLDSRKKGKEKYFLDYEMYESVTRLEIEMRSNYCKKFRVKLKNVFDNNFLFSLYSDFLCNRLRQFAVLNFIQAELTKIGFQTMYIDKSVIDKSLIISASLYKKRFVNQAMKICKTYKTNPIEILEAHKELQDALKQHGASEELIKKTEEIFNSPVFRSYLNCQ